MSTASVDAVVVGASAAGLASAACLGRAGVDHIVFEQSNRVGRAWRGHYDRLHLHTPRVSSGLPFVPMPRSYPWYPSRDQVVDYLEYYAQRTNVRPRFEHRVDSIRRDSDRWLVTAGESTVTARSVVVATGYTRVPHVPTWPGMDEYDGEIYHSSEYDNGERWKGKRVLVVGFGNSGGEIAIDLVEHGAEPDMAVRSPVNVIPRDIFGVPVLALGILMRPIPARIADTLGEALLGSRIGDIEKLGLRKLPYGPNEQIRRTGRIPLLDIGTIDLIRRGRIGVRRGVERFAPDGVVFADGRSGQYEAVVLATGYRPEVSDFLERPDVLDAEGTPKRSGIETAPGLYFCGFYVSPAGMLREIGIEARKIARAIAG